MTTNYRSGKFTGTAKGMHEPVNVELDIENNKITSAKIDLGSAAKSYAKVAEKLANEIVTKQSNEIDAVSGASVTSRAVQDAAYDALRKADDKEVDLSLQDGTYSATANGHGGPVEVTLTTANNRINSVEVTKQTETPYVGDTAMKVIPKEIVQQQTLNVDAITGATMTSEAVINAAHKALAKAGNASAWANKLYQSRVPAAVDREVDLVVAGAGVSGLATAAFAAKRGLKVLVLEKNGQVGGSFRYAAGLFTTYNSEAAKKAKQSNDWTDLMNWIKKANEIKPGRPINLKFLQHILRESGKTFDQMLEMTNSKPSFVKMPYTMSTYGVGGKAAQLLAKYIEDHDGEILTNTVISKINEDGERVTGVEARNQNGEFTVTAKSVVIATGGASYNKQKLLAEAMPSVKNIHLFNEANIANTGDGYDLLRDLGAKFYNNDVYKSAELDFNPRLSITYANEPDYSKAMLINSEGKRFANEAPFNLVNLTTQTYREGSSSYYLLYDEKLIPSDLKAKLAELPENPRIGVKAASIKELAEKINIDPKQLQATFANYQAACEKGQDEFGKSQENLVKFSDTGDYYAVYVIPGSWGTIGGVKINDRMQVEKEDGSYFDNLYAVGEMSTGELFSAYYMIGFSLGDYSTEGRLVAERL